MNGRQEKMDKRELSIVVILVFSLFIAFSVLPSVQASTFYVPDGYETIQAAVEAASHGDTIIVRDGMYIENIEVNKSLTIRSENGPESTIVRVENPGYDVFSVTADYVTISGFTVEGTTGWFGAGISLDNADYCNISDNHCLNNYHGIYIANSNKNSIANNICTSNLLASIFIQSSANNKLSGNDLCESGIWFDSDSIANYTHEIDDSNTVNGKPVYYWNDVTGGRVPDDAGQVILLNCTNVAVEDQNVNNTSIGIEVAFSSNIAIINNTCSYNKYAIILSYSSNNKLNGNVMVEDGILISGNSLGDYMHEIDTSNTINGKPVYYWQNVDGGRVPDGAGQVIVANCTNIIIEDQDVTNASVGIAVAFSSDLAIRNNICSYNRFGILLEFSSNNRIEQNTANTNSLDGIRLRFHSNNNIIANNTAKNNSNSGILLLESNNNRITNNNVSNSTNYDGIYLNSANNNEIRDNIAISNNDKGIELLSSNENIIANNTAKE